MSIVSSSGSEPRGENDDPAAAADSSPARRLGRMTWRRIEAKLGENAEEMVLIVKGIPSEYDGVIEGSSPSSKRMRIIFVERSESENNLC